MDSSVYYARDSGQNKETSNTTQTRARPGSEIRDIDNNRSGVRDISVPRDVYLKSPTIHNRETSGSKDACAQLPKTSGEIQVESQNRRDFR